MRLVLARVYTPIAFTAEHYKLAISWFMEHADKASKYGQNQRHQLFGFMGEVAFQIMRPDAVVCHDKCFDFISNGKRVEVKTTTTPYEPRDDFNFSIAKLEAPDTYDLIACFYANTKTADIYYLGYLYPSDLVGKERPSGFEMTGGNKFRVDGYRIPFSELR